MCVYVCVYIRKSTAGVTSMIGYMNQQLRTSNMARRLRYIHAQNYVWYHKPQNNSIEYQPGLEAVAYESKSLVI